jgi:hypothetical protein
MVLLGIASVGTARCVTLACINMPWICHVRAGGMAPLRPRHVHAMLANPALALKFVRKCHRGIVFLCRCAWRRPALYVRVRLYVKWLQRVTGADLGAAPTTPPATDVPATPANTTHNTLPTTDVPPITTNTTHNTLPATDVAAVSV